jgi:ankyrin repeat protein
MNNFVFWNVFDGLALVHAIVTAPRTGEVGLIAAAAREDEKAVAALISEGVNPTCHDNEALLLAAYGFPSVVSLLLRSGADAKAHSSKALECAAYFGDVATVKILIEAGAEVGAADNAALRAAAFKGQNEALRYLLSVGADVHALGAGLW